MTFAEYLRKARLSLGLTQDEIARKLSTDEEPVTVFKVTGWETGRKIPNRFEEMGLRIVLEGMTGSTAEENVETAP